MVPALRGAPLGRPALGRRLALRGRPALRRRRIALLAAPDGRLALLLALDLRGLFHAAGALGCRLPARRIRAGHLLAEHGLRRRRGCSATHVRAHALTALDVDLAGVQHGAVSRLAAERVLLAPALDLVGSVAEAL